MVSGANHITKPIARQQQVTFSDHAQRRRALPAVKESERIFL